MGNRRETSLKAGAIGLRACAARALRALLRLRSDDRGQATLEYILILAAVVIGSGLISRTIINTIDTGILKLGGQLEKDLKTGRAPLSVWQN